MNRTQSLTLTLFLVAAVAVAPAQTGPGTRRRPVGSQAMRPQGGVESMALRKGGLDPAKVNISAPKSTLSPVHPADQVVSFLYRGSLSLYGATDILSIDQKAGDSFRLGWKLQPNGSGTVQNLATFTVSAYSPGRMTLTVIAGGNLGKNLVFDFTYPGGNQPVPLVVYCPQYTTYVDLKFKPNSGRDETYSIKRVLLKQVTSK